MKIISKLSSLESIKALQNEGADIYVVGGCVRDSFLNKESKDIDIVVRLLDDHQIISILEKYGKVDKVGESFGVIKFKPHGWTEEPIDIAQPRIDILIDKKLGHHGIQAKFDKNIPIEYDLKRRDFTINSIAVKLDGTIIDPFNGIEDIKNKVISATSIDAFSEDPLRMLRVINFSSRFNFTIDKLTWNMLVINSEDIKSISGERILEELEKIYHKGDILYGLKLFKDSRLHSNIFEKDMIYNFIDEIKTKSDFYFTVCGHSELYKTILKGENTVYYGIKSIEKLYSCDFEDIFLLRKSFFEALQISDEILYSSRIPSKYLTVQKDFVDGKYPKSIKDIGVSGDDLMKLGYIGKQIGEKMKDILYDILNNNYKY